MSRPDTAPNGPRPIRVLLLHSDRVVRSTLLRVLAKHGMDVTASGDGARALESVTRARTDVLVIDLALRDPPGLEVIATLRARDEHPPILSCSSLGGTEALVAALQAGADDFVRWPFEPEELAARLHALDRRAHYGAHGAPHARLDPVRSTLTIRGTKVRLTPKELRIAATLLAARGGFVGKDRLLGAVWPPDREPSINVLYTQISNLRRKLDTLGLGGVLESRRGAGYRIEVG